MRVIVEILSVLTAAVALAPSLAHALEWPGKMRLSEDQYRATQPIYYPGFTFAGFAEPASIVLVLLLMLLTPADGARFWLTAGALAALVAMHGAYWLLTHPVNKVWLRDTKLGGAGRGFFEMRATEASKADWTVLRDRWERSHLVRAGLAAAGFVLLTTALAIG